MILYDGLRGSMRLVRGGLTGFCRGGFTAVKELRGTYYSMC